MIVNIPEDIDTYESKNIGNFTNRQLVCGVLALPVIAGLFFVLYRATESIELASVAAILGGFPIILCGVVKRHKLYMEQIMRYKLEWRFKYPRKRPSVMRNLYEDMIALDKEVDEIETEEPGQG